MGSLARPSCRGGRRRSARSARRRRGRRAARPCACAQPAAKHEQRRGGDTHAREYTARRCSCLTRELPGTGGLHKATPEDFVVDELPAYPPSGEGTHTFLRIEKRGADHRRGGRAPVPRARRRAARRRRRRAERSAGDDAPVDLAARRRSRARARRLRRGRARPRGGAPRPQAAHRPPARQPLHAHVARRRADGVERARAILERLAARRHAQLLRPAALRRARRQRRPRQAAPRRGRDARRGSARTSGACWSAPISRSCSTATSTRASPTALVDRALAGDVLKKTDTGGLFTVDDTRPRSPTPRRASTRRAVVVTGPMYGHKMMSPPAGTASPRARTRCSPTRPSTPRPSTILGKLAEGTRRPLLVPLGAAAGARRRHAPTRSCSS